MKILVTGAHGFTGREFIRSATAAGHETLPLRANLTDAGAVGQEVAGLEVDAVVHLAAISFVGHAGDRDFYDVNLFGTLNLLDALRSAGRPLKKVLLASSANVYGNSEHSPIGETQPPAPVNHYAMSKLAMECMSRGRQSPALPIVITRPFNYTGPGQAPQFIIPKLVDHFRRRAPSVAMGNLHVQREYNDVRFVCAAYLGLLDSKSSGGTYNVCTGQTYSFQDVLQILEELTGHRLEVRVDPSLVRANEVHRLCGDPTLLRGTVDSLPQYSLRETLSSMLSS